MRISEVCEKTNLTEKAVRFYIEKGLLKKEAQIINGRNCRDYNEEDISILKDISILRNAGFSIQDILTMQMVDADISTLLNNQILLLENESASYQNISKILKAIPCHEHMCWRDLARCIRNYDNYNLNDIKFHWPEDEVISYKSPNRVPSIFVIIAIVCSILFSLIFWVIYNRPLTTIITISDVKFHDKWTKDGEMYVKISCNNDEPIGYDIYFAESQVLKIIDSAYYESLKLEPMFYNTVNLQIEMSYGTTLQNKLLDPSSKISSIDIDELLLNSELITDYCKIIRIVD